MGSWENHSKGLVVRICECRSLQCTILISFADDLSWWLCHLWNKLFVFKRKKQKALSLLEEEGESFERKRVRVVVLKARLANPTVLITGYFTARLSQRNGWLSSPWLCLLTSCSCSLATKLRFHNNLHMRRASILFTVGVVDFHVVCSSRIFDVPRIWFGSHRLDSLSFSIKEPFLRR